MQHWRCKLLLFGTRQIWMPSPGAEKGAGILVLQVFLVAKVFNSLLALSLICCKAKFLFSTLLWELVQGDGLKVCNALPRIWAC